MEEQNKFEVISVAYRSRLVFRSAAEYCSALGATFGTVVNKRDSERDMETYYGILNRAAALTTDRALDEVVEAYTEASAFYLRLDWGDRSQMASRKRFCRMLFRIAATAGRRLTSDEVFKFKTKNADEWLLRAFFPDGTEGEPAVNIGFILLFAFGIVRPWDADNSRGRDIRDKETLESLHKLRELLEILKDDTPRLGSLEKPLAFDECLEIIGDKLNSPDSLDDWSPLQMATMLMDTGRACRALVVSEQQRMENDRLHGLYMHGIWVDDGDGGRSRFWIFPDNFLMAMCFQRNGVAWEAGAYEFRVRSAFNPVYRDTFTLMTPRGNLAYTLSPDRVIPNDQLVSGGLDVFADESTGEFNRLKLFEDMCSFPRWMNWHTWERLAADDPRYKEFRTVLRDVYNPQSPLSVIFRNIAPELSDNVNNFIGRDRKYFYVFDWRPRRFVIKERQPDEFTYEGESTDNFTFDALFELPVSEEHPLYAVPLLPKRRNYGTPELDRFAEILTDAENIVEAYVIHSEHTDRPRLVLPSYGFSIALDPEALAPLGVRRFTRRPF